MVQVAVGFAADLQGNGVAYARLGDQLRPQQIFRVPFVVKRCAALLEREVGYAALTSVISNLHRRGVRRVRLSIEDGHLAADLREHRDVPAALTLAYVRLGCGLNQFADYAIVSSPQDASDLTHRARTELAMHVAA